MDMTQKFALFLAKLGPCGLSPLAPGTVASAAATLAAPWLFLPFSLPLRLAVLVSLFFAGAWAAGQAEQVMGVKDPSSVVVDELVGQWIVFLTLSMEGVPLLPLALGFALFRFFDVLKPWPVGASEHWLPGGFGVMIDDVLAGFLGLAVLLVLRWLWPEGFAGYMV